MIQNGVKINQKQANKKGKKKKKNRCKYYIYSDLIIVIN